MKRSEDGRAYLRRGIGRHLQPHRAYGGRACAAHGRGDALRAPAHRMPVLLAADRTVSAAGGLARAQRGWCWCSGGAVSVVSGWDGAGSRGRRGTEGWVPQKPPEPHEGESRGDSLSLIRHATAREPSGRTALGFATARTIHIQSRVRGRVRRSRREDERRAVRSTRECTTQPTVPFTTPECASHPPPGSLPPSSNVTPRTPPRGHSRAESRACAVRTRMDERWTS